MASGESPERENGEGGNACALQELFAGVELAVFAGVVQRDVSVGAFVAVIDFAHIERFGVNVDADGALIEFGKIQDLMNGFERIDVGRMCRVHLINVCGDKIACSAVFSIGMAILDTKVLHFEAADWRGHPAILVAMIVDAAELADFPADGHAFEHVVLENQVAGVAAFGEEEIFLERFGTDGMVEDEVLNIFEGEVAVGDGREAFDPVIYDELFDCELFGHGKSLRRKV